MIKEQGVQIRLVPVARRRAVEVRLWSVPQVRLGRRSPRPQGGISSPPTCAPSTAALPCRPRQVAAAQICHGAPALPPEASVGAGLEGAVFTIPLETGAPAVCPSETLLRRVGVSSVRRC